MVWHRDDLARSIAGHLTPADRIGKLEPCPVDFQWHGAPLSIAIDHFATRGRRSRRAHVVAAHLRPLERIRDYDTAGRLVRLSGHVGEAISNGVVEAQR